MRFFRAPYFRLTIAAALISSAGFAKEYTLLSPDKQTTVKVDVTTDVRWSVSYNGETLLTPSAIAMDISGGRLLGKNPVVKTTKLNTVNKVIEAVVPVKTRYIPEVYNEIKLSFKGDYSIVFRAYNDGVAYRFETDFADASLQVNSEQADFNFSANHHVFWPTETDTGYQSHYESIYKDSVLNGFGPKQHGALPFMITTAKGTSILISESDLDDYPNLFLFGTNGPALTANFPHVILDKKPSRDRSYRITQLAPYIAETKGKRTYPWRSMAIANNDKGLLENNLTYKLGTPNVLQNTSWIKPGRVAWDWWNANNIYGVDFKAGINTNTYKYYIDFAAAYGLEYIILDEGWSKTTTNVLETAKDIDMPALMAYAESKKIGIILWTLWNPLEDDDKMNKVLDQFAAWGAKGIKVDFMARADQWMVNYYERVAAACAKHQLLVDFHGAYKPVGLNRKYPHVISYEGVQGAENNKWGTDVTPKHNTTLPFIRMAAGPMDYTPGAMINATKKNFSVVYTEPMSQGTRAHQAAMYVVFESPLQMLADNPSNYLKEPAYTKFIAQIPSVWDTTIALHGKAGEMVAIARKKGNKWYIGAMTNWTARSLPVTLSFLSDKTYTIEALQDGINADEHAADYKITTGTVKKGDAIVIEMKPGGGWCAVLTEARL